MNPEISVIIPAYNVENYLERSINSIRNQTFSDMEIIIVDDAATDNTAQIASRFVSEDTRIRLIRHPLNKGLGGARNTGIDASRGKYLFFLDSDDWIELNTLEVLHNNAIASNADIIECGSRLVYDDGRENAFLSNSFTVKGGLCSLDMISDYKIGFMAWDKLYKASLIKNNKLEFPPILHEDINFAIKCVYLANTVKVIPDMLYNYYQRNASISKSVISQRHLDSYFEVINYHNQFVDEFRIDEKNSKLNDKLYISLLKWLTTNLIRLTDENDESQVDKMLLSAISKRNMNERHLIKLLVKQLVDKYKDNDFNIFERNISVEIDGEDECIMEANRMVDTHKLKRTIKQFVPNKLIMYYKRIFKK